MICEYYNTRQYNVILTFNDLMDSQITEYSQESIPAPQNPPPPEDNDDEEYWKAFKDISLPSEEEIRLPEGCPDTAMHRHSYRVLEEARKEAMVDKDHHYSSQIARTRMETEINTRPDDRLLAHHITRNFEVPAQVVEKC